MLYALRSQRIEGVILRLLLPITFLVNWLGLFGIGLWVMWPAEGFADIDARAMMLLALLAMVIALGQFLLAAWYGSRQSDQLVSNPLRKLMAHSENLVMDEYALQAPKLILDKNNQIDYLERLDQALFELAKMRLQQIEGDKRNSQYRQVLEQRVERRTQSIEFERVAMAAILAHLRDGVVALNAQGIVKIANPAFLKLVGRKKSEVLGQPISNFVQYAEEHTDEVLIAEAVVIDEGDNQIPVDIARTRLKPGENDRFATIMSLRDMSNQMAQAEGEQFQAFYSGAAESSMALLFNVNEATLSVYQEVLGLNRMLQPGSSEQQQLGVIQKSVQRVVDMMASQNDALFLSSQSDDYSLREVMKESITIAKRQYPDANVSIRVRWGDFDDQLFGPRSEILKVLVRILCDASESVQAQQASGPDDGEIKIWLQRPNHEWFEIDIADNGQGMDNPTLQSLFRRPDDKGQNAGALYGLAVTLDNLGGRLSAASDGPGQGMRVSLMLRAKD